MALYNGASTSNSREYANNGRFNQSTSHSLSIWVFPLATPVAQWGFVARGITTTSGEFTLGTPASATFQLARAAMFTSALVTIADTLNWTNNRWFHMCQTWDGTVFRLYVDGKERNSSAPGGTWTQSATSNVRLWMRTDGTIGTTNCYLEQFGWWSRKLQVPEVEFLSRGGDFTRIQRENALILDPLQDPSQRELVAGLGTNTGTVSVVERAPILRVPPGVITLNSPRVAPRPMRKRRIGIAPATTTFQGNRFMPFFGR